MPAPTGRRRHKTGYNVFQTHSLGKIRKLQLAVCFHWRLFLFALHKFVALIVMMALRWAFKFVALKEWGLVYPWITAAEQSFQIGPLLSVSDTSKTLQTADVHASPTHNYTIILSAGMLMSGWYRYFTGKSLFDRYCWRAKIITHPYQFVSWQPWIKKKKVLWALLSHQTWRYSCKTWPRETQGYVNAVRTFTPSSTFVL